MIGKDSITKNDDGYSISVYGLGGIGLGIAAVWVRAGMKVFGVDVDGERVFSINKGDIDHPDKLVVNTLRKAVEEKNFSATVDGVEASVKTKIKVIIVPLLIKNNEPDFSSIEDASTKIGLGLKKNDIVIIETSLPPGTTLNFIKPILEKNSGLKAGSDFYLAYSPERVVVEHIVYDIEKAYPKIVGGINMKSLEMVKSLYKKIVRKGVVTVSSPTVAEFTKLAEGVYRDVNIALANELADLARILGVNFNEVMMAANSQPYSHIHKPGPGVGGICIPIYPKLMSWVARKYNLHLFLTEKARFINENQPKKIVSLVEKGIQKARLKSPRILILGLTFKKDSNDFRLSPSLTIINILRQRNYKISIYDPFIEKTCCDDIIVYDTLLDAIRENNIIVLTTDHSEFYGLTLKKIIENNLNKKIVVVDTRQIIDLNIKTPLKDGKEVYYIGIGYPWKHIK